MPGICKRSKEPLYKFIRLHLCHKGRLSVVVRRECRPLPDTIRIQRPHHKLILDGIGGFIVFFPVRFQTNDKIISGILTPNRNIIFVCFRDFVIASVHPIVNAYSYSFCAFSRNVISFCIVIPLFSVPVQFFSTGSVPQRSFRSRWSPRSVPPPRPPSRNHQVQALNRPGSAEWHAADKPLQRSPIFRAYTALPPRGSRPA